MSQATATLNVIASSRLQIAAERFNTAGSIGGVYEAVLDGSRRVCCKVRGGSVGSYGCRTSGKLRSRLVFVLGARTPADLRANSVVILDQSGGVSSSDAFAMFFTLGTRIWLCGRWLRVATEL